MSSFLSSFFVFMLCTFGFRTERGFWSGFLTLTFFLQAGVAFFCCVWWLAFWAGFLGCRLWLAFSAWADRFRSAVLLAALRLALFYTAVLLLSADRKRSAFF